MASRQAMNAAFRAADARLDRLAPRIATYAEDHLLDDGGKWSVRDCLSHVAASAQIAAAGQRALLRARGEAPAPTAGGPTLDERTQAQVEERRSKSVAELIAETKEAHAAAQLAIRAMTDTELDTKVPDMQPNRPAASVGGIMMRFLEYHEGRQVDRIEDALRLRTRWV